jgi:hypothetical protein
VLWRADLQACMVRSRRSCGNASLSQLIGGPASALLFEVTVAGCPVQRSAERVPSAFKLVRRWFGSRSSELLTFGSPLARRLGVALDCMDPRAHTCSLHLSSIFAFTHSRRRVTKGAPPPRLLSLFVQIHPSLCFCPGPLSALMLAPCFSLS